MPDIVDPNVSNRPFSSRPQSMSLSEDSIRPDTLRHDTFGTGRWNDENAVYRSEILSREQRDDLENSGVASNTTYLDTEVGPSVSALGKRRAPPDIDQYQSNARRSAILDTAETTRASSTQPHPAADGIELGESASQLAVPTPQGPLPRADDNETVHGIYPSSHRSMRVLYRYSLAVFSILVPILAITLGVLTFVSLYVELHNKEACDIPIVVKLQYAKDVVRNWGPAGLLIVSIFRESREQIDRVNLWVFAALITLFIMFIGSSIVLAALAKWEWASMSVDLSDINLLLTTFFYFEWVLRRT